MQSFLELYIALCRALAQHRGVKYPELKKRLVEARALSGDSLTAMINKWYQQTNYLSEEIKYMDEVILGYQIIPECLRDLHIYEIFSDTGFSQNSRKNLWPYIQGLACHAREAQNDVVTDDDLEPAPRSDPFCESSHDELKALEKIAQALPPKLMEKMQTIASGFQQKITTGEKKIDDINFSDVLADVMEAMKDVDMTDFMKGQNITELINSLQSSEIMKVVGAMSANMPKSAEV